MRIAVRIRRLPRSNFSSSRRRGSVSGLPVIALGGESDSTFLVNGRPVTYTTEQMAQLRGFWSEPAPYVSLRTGLTESEARWSADFIAIQERSRSPGKPCQRLELLSISPSPPDVLDVLGRRHPAGKLKPDELWTLNACGSKRSYRVFQPANSLALSIFEARL
jgi:hypothetical protein